jgi:4-hydroxybenzoate polyprenyltransferase
MDAPVVVDLDGTLLRSDLLIESAFAFVGSHPLRIVSLIGLLSRGKAALKDGIASKTAIDVKHLPYDDRVLEIMEEARRDGRKIYIASASNERYVEAIASHLGVDGWFASDAVCNLSTHAKARKLVEAFGEKQFDYLGDDHADLAVWAVCRKGWAVHPSSGVKRAIAETGTDVTVISPRSGNLRQWIKLIRVHQWAKNGLVFIALLTSHNFELLALAQAFLAFLAFSFAASAVYIVNDLVDLEADRKHRSKKRRPLAAGTVPILAAVPVAAVLAAVAFVVSLSVRLEFAGALFVYLCLTTAYSFFLKRKMLVDVVVLAALYTIRVIGGGLAIDVAISEWLLGFSMFIFTSLALIKRYVGLLARVDADLPDPTNRNYQRLDVNIVAMLAAAAGMNAVTVFALYISSDAVAQMYSHPTALWLICPILIYWLARALMMAHRRRMEDDPILFALKDRNSYLAGALIVAIMYFSA